MQCCPVNISGEPSVKVMGLKCDIDVKTELIGPGRYKCTYIPELPGEKEKKLNHLSHILRLQKIRLLQSVRLPMIIGAATLATNRWWFSNVIFAISPNFVKSFERHVLPLCRLTVK